MSDGWKEFYKRFPAAPGMLTLSRVGFSHDQRRALLYYGNHYGGLGGEGFLVLMEWDGDRWTIQKERMVWVS